MGDFMICTFFGHRDAPQGIEDTLRKILLDLIKSKKVNILYVGNQGDFDFMVKSVLKDLGAKYYVVLPYLPTKVDAFDSYDYTKTIFPDDLETTPPKFAISKRNLWLIEKSDIVVTYVTKTFGGAFTFKQQAIKKGKTVIELSDINI